MISWKAVYDTVFQSSLEQITSEAQFTASVLIIPQISLLCQVPLFNESHGVAMCWRPGDRVTYVNLLSN